MSAISMEYTASSSTSPISMYNWKLNVTFGKKYKKFYESQKGSLLSVGLAPLRAYHHS